MRNVLPVGYLARFSLPTAVAGGIVHNCMPRRQARRALSEAGFKHVGGGSFSSVWKRGDRVVKISKPDAGAEAICEVAVAFPLNPAVPSYFARCELLNGGYAYEIEALEPLQDEAFDEVRTMAAGLLCKPMFSDPVKVSDEHRAALTEALTALKQLVTETGGDDNEEGGSLLGWDLHRGNVMNRGPMPVLSDPLYDPNEFGGALKGTRGTDTGTEAPLPTGLTA